MPTPTIRPFGPDDSVDVVALGHEAARLNATDPAQLTDAHLRAWATYDPDFAIVVQRRRAAAIANAADARERAAAATRAAARAQDAAAATARTNTPGARITADQIIAVIDAYDAAAVPAYHRALCDQVAGLQREIAALRDQVVELLADKATTP